MKLRIALLTADELYGNRLVQRFQEKYADMLEIAQFSKAESALRNLEANRTDILLNDGITIHEPLPRGCIMMELTENKSQAAKDDQRFALKYQKAEDLYKLVMSRIDGIVDIPAGEKLTGIIAFLSPAGGCGSTTAAVATGIYFARKGQRVLFLECNPFDDTGVFFAESPQGMRNLLLGLKRSAGKDNSVGALLASVVSTSPENLDYIGTSGQPEDLLSVSGSLVTDFLKQTAEIKQYDWVIADLPAYPADTVLQILENANYIIVTSDGSVRANMAIERFHGYLQNQDERQGMHICRHLRLLYNRFSSRYSKEYTKTDIPSLGGLGRVESGDPMEIVRILADKLSEKTTIDEIRPVGK